jgi:hypothetical protein
MLNFGRYPHCLSGKLLLLKYCHVLLSSQRLGLNFGLLFSMAIGRSMCRYGHVWIYTHYFFGQRLGILMYNSHV